MLAEALTWLTTPCTPLARQLGYLQEAVALQYRARRCRQAWRPHLEQSQQFLLEAAGEGGHRAMLLGSGLLLDIPLDALAQRFDEIWLVDLIHLRQVRRQVKSYSGVHLLEADLSGTLAKIQGLRQRRRPVNATELANVFSQQPALPELGPLDWIASVNLFSQLPLLPLVWAERLCPDIPANTLSSWQAQLLGKHLGWVQHLAPRSCFLADARQETRNSRGEILEVTDYTPLLACLGQPQATWRWQLAPTTETGRDESREHLVQAYICS